MLNELQHLRPLNAGDRNRTGTVSLQQDFKSCASANSATPAKLLSKYNLFIHKLQLFC